MTRPTKAGPTRPLTSAGSLDGGGGTLFGGAVESGLVPTSTGSNTWLWLENVRRISVNQTTNVQGPFVNIANGSNTTVTVDMVGAVASNTIRVHATGGGSVSFGSNATRVSEMPFVGAGSDSARTDHIHDGIGTITASSSNTMQRGTWNVRAGTGIALALTDTDGDGEFDTTTIVNTGQSAAAGGGGSFIGQNTIGASWVTLTAKMQLCKSVTLSADSLIESVDAYLRPSTDNVTGVWATVLADNSGNPGVLQAASGIPTDSLYLSNSSSMPGAGRWLSFPMGAWLAAGTYWLCIMGQNNRIDIAYDASVGADKNFTSSLFIATGAYPSAWTINSSTDRYSIRARIST